MEVLAGAERLLHARIIRNVRQHAQLDLTVVRVDQHPAGARDEHAANFAAQLRAHRDILQIRVRGGKAARRRDRVLERRADAAVRPDDLLQAIGIG